MADKALSDMKEQQAKVETLTKRINAYENMFGFSCINQEGQIILNGFKSSKKGTDSSQSNSSEVLPESLQKLTSQLAEKQKRLDAVTLERDEMSKASQLMENELESLCKLADQLQEQASTHVEGINSRQRHISRLISEKSKYEENSWF